MRVLRAPGAAGPLRKPRGAVQGMRHQAQLGVGVALELAIEEDPVLRLLLPSGLSRTGDALCLDRHPGTTSFCLLNRLRELDPNVFLPDPASIICPLPGTGIGPNGCNETGGK